MSVRVLRRVAAATVAITGCAALIGMAAPAPVPAASTADSPSAAAADPVKVQLLSLTDFHGYIRPHDDTGNGTVPGPGGTRIVVGGAPYLATHWQRLAWPENSIQFAVGDPRGVAA
jgi:5'-nucleotidase